MLTAYLLINCVMYLIFGVWCAVAPEWTASAVGLQYISPHGYSEYVAVYGGLEFGIGLFFLMGYLKQNLRSAVVIFGLLLYAGLAGFRLTAVLTNSSQIGNGWTFFLTEISLFIWSIFLYKKTSAA